MKKISIIPNENKDVGLYVTKKLVEEIASRAELYMEKKFATTGMNVTFLERDELFDNADCVIVLGGDGTILRVAEPCGKKNIPVMGINMGKVGFMTEVNVKDIKKACDAILSDKYTIEKRMMMEIAVVKNNMDEKKYYALNDVVVSKAFSPMISIELHSNGEKINEYTADGLIISTPTGSTGYSLSAGGPVADPTMELFIASPICAHTLHARPALMPSEKPIQLTVSHEQDCDALVTVDGNICSHITIGDKVIISKANYYVGIIKIGNQSFYEVLTQKLK